MIQMYQFFFFFLGLKEERPFLFNKILLSIKHGLLIRQCQSSVVERLTIDPKLYVCF